MGRVPTLVRPSPTAPKVVEAIVELAQIMRDLSTLVVEQGTMLDRVDHNVTEAAMKARGAQGLCGGGGASLKEPATPGQAR